jgi:hypothetical protein
MKMNYIAWVTTRAAMWILLWLFYAPIAVGIAIAKLISGRWLLSDSAECPTCGGEVPLLGLWECSACRFRFYGFFFSRCALCGNTPAYINCTYCGASLLSPLI